MGDNRALEWENTVVLTVVQALLGMVDTRHLKGVAVGIDGESVAIYFAVSERNPEIEEDVRDIVGDVEGLMWPRIPNVKGSIFVGSASGAWQGRQHRLVFLSKS